MTMTSAEATRAPAESRSTQRPAWQRKAMRALVALFFLGIAALIVQRAMQVEWSKVGEALRAFGPTQMLAAFALSLAGYACAASYDLLGRRYVGHRLPVGRTLGINAIAYAFSLNLGALAGGWGFRLRLYTRFGLELPVVARLILFAVVTNWSGFILVAGVLLLGWPPALPEPWSLPETALRGIGAVLVLLIAAYLLLCAIGHRRGWKLHWRGEALDAPPLTLALAQVTMSSASWLLMAAALAQLLPDTLAFERTLTALFAASLLGAALHVPGSVGVLEGGLTTLLGGEIGGTTALAGALAFRVVYYFLPFVMAAIAYLGMERASRRNAMQAA
jgi:glycosyltransferase 2 family protein